MKTGGGSPKGAEWERVCCKRLSLYVTNGQRDDVFWRTAISGGRATFQLRQGVLNRAQAGDVTAISPEGLDWCERYLWECKHRKNLNFTGLVTQGTGLLAEFWRATQAAARRLDKQPILIAKQNFYPPIVLCPVGCDVFRGAPWATLHVAGVHVYRFEPATEVVRPLHKRPREVRAAQ